MYFSEHKFVVEIDEKGNIDRNQNEKKKKYKQKQKSILIASFFQDIFLEISEIQNQITKSNENKSKFAKKLLTYVSKISKPIKHIYKA